MSQDEVWRSWGLTWMEPAFLRTALELGWVGWLQYFLEFFHSKLLDSVPARVCVSELLS